MSEENNFDFSDLYQNEESVDLTAYMTSANLELCDDDLFQSLFPSSPANVNNIKTEKVDLVDQEVDWWSSPGSTCSSAVQSPVPFFSTPPVTPKSKFQETNQYQLQQEHMSRTQFTPIAISEGTPKGEMYQVAVKTEPVAPTQLSQYFYVNNEIDGNNNTSRSMPALIKPDPGNQKPNMKRPMISGDEKVSVKRAKAVNKGTEEYRLKRERNNVAVRKSRDKAKQKSQETEHRVSALSDENKRLHERVAELTHELATLKDILKALPQRM